MNVILNEILFRQTSSCYDNFTILENSTFQEFQILIKLKFAEIKEFCKILLI